MITTDFPPCSSIVLLRRAWSTTCDRVMCPVDRVAEYGGLCQLAPVTFALIVGRPTVNTCSKGQHNSVPPSAGRFRPLFHHQCAGPQENRQAGGTTPAQTSPMVGPHVVDATPMALGIQHGDLKKMVRSLLPFVGF